MRYGSNRFPFSRKARAAIDPSIEQGQRGRACARHAGVPPASSVFPHSPSAVRHRAALHALLIATVHGNSPGADSRPSSHYQDATSDADRRRPHVAVANEPRKSSDRRGQHTDLTRECQVRLGQRPRPYIERPERAALSRVGARRTWRRRRSRARSDRFRISRDGEARPGSGCVVGRAKPWSAVAWLSRRLAARGRRSLSAGRSRRSQRCPCSSEAEACGDPASVPTLRGWRSRASDRPGWTSVSALSAGAEPGPK